jgi:membrane-bound ClpP family serine protease
MFVLGLLMIGLGIAMIVGAFVLPDEARIGLIGAAGGVGGSGMILAYLNWPSRRKPPEGMVHADAFVLAARLTGGEAAGSRMVEMTLEVRPRGGAPFQVTRKFVGAMPRIESGQKVAVNYDPVNPDRVELA